MAHPRRPVPTKIVPPAHRSHDAMSIATALIGGVPFITSFPAKACVVAMATGDNA